jgi:hypothetical protein
MSDTKIYEARVRATIEVDLYYEVPVPLDLSERNVDLYIEEWCRNAYYHTDLNNHISSFETVDVEVDYYSETSL